MLLLAHCGRAGPLPCWFVRRDRKEVALSRPAWTGSSETAWLALAVRAEHPVYVSPSGSSGLMAASRRVSVGSCAPSVCRASVGRTDAGVRFTRGRRHRGGVPGAWVASSRVGASGRCHFVHAGAAIGTDSCASSTISAPIPSACAAAPDAGATDGHTAIETITTDPRNRASFTPPAGSPSSRSASAEAFAATLGDHRPLSFSTGPAHPPLRWPHGAVGTGVVCRIYWAAFRVSTASRRDGGGSPPRLS